MFIIKRTILPFLSAIIILAGCTQQFSLHEASLKTERFLEAKPVVYKVETVVDESGRTVRSTITTIEMLPSAQSRSLSEQYLYTFSSFAGGRSGNGNYYGEIWDYYSLEISFQTLRAAPFHKAEKAAGETEIKWISV
ncbi:hypothetical protein [Bacillus marinisedimentorum]|uniref:hypothetical protein n=1 Tax=Bacillus marinisedimentorum TaxID=1821260 RepID=UPI0007E15FFB|nr:hypothetical protein [Bacillus marinisedimentorum]